MFAAAPDHRRRLRVVAGALSLTGLVVVGVIEREMTGQIDDALPRADADFTERAITRGTGLPMGEGPTDLYVQFVDDGRGRRAGHRGVGPAALLAPSQRDRTIVTVTDSELGELRVLAMPAPNNPDAHPRPQPAPHRTWRRARDLDPAARTARCRR